MAQRTLRTPRGDYTLSYLLEGPAEGQKVLFLHGWGATKELMKNSFSRHCGRWQALYLDLPGFGGSSSFEPLTTGEYAAIIRAFLDDLGFTPQAIVGHSFGGKVATLLDPPLLVLLSSAGIVKRKSLKVRLKIALAKSFGFLKSDRLRERLRTRDAAGLPEHMYETLKNVVDEDFSAVFAARTKPALIFWGKNDRATPLYTGEALHRLIAGSRFFPLAGDHFFFAGHGALITQEIAKAIEGA